MQDTYLQDTYLQNTYLQNTYLQNTYLQDTYLQNTYLQNTYLQKYACEYILPMFGFWVLVFVIIFAIALYLLYHGNMGLTYLGYTSSNDSDVRSLDIWSANIEKETLENKDWRRVLTTTDGLQVVAMNTPRGESLGWEVHNDNDQFFRVEKGTALLSTAAVCGAPSTDVRTVKLTDGMSAVVPRGVCHNVLNIGNEPLHMYTIYGPKHHPPGTVDHTHKDELAREAVM